MKNYKSISVWSYSVAGENKTKRGKEKGARKRSAQTYGRLTSKVGQLALRTNKQVDNSLTGLTQRKKEGCSKKQATVYIASYLKKKKTTPFFRYRSGLDYLCIGLENTKTRKKSSGPHCTVPEKSL